MKRRRASSASARLRRGVQLAFLLLFLGLLVLMRPRPGGAPSEWLGLFFYLDPLALLLTAVAAHSVPLVLLAALVIVAITAVLGRVFCGWMCPLGTLHAAVSRAMDPWRKPRTERWSRWQTSKYYVLAAVIVMASLGLQWVALLDPIALLYRSIATALMPAAQLAVEAAAGAVYRADPGVDEWRLTALTEPAYRFLRDNVFVRPRQAFLGSGLILSFFVLTLALNAVRRRFWCRYVCPLGGLLGLLAWRPWLVRKTDAHACNQCELCGLACHGAATDDGASGWRPQECMGCLNCTDGCPERGVKFVLRTPWAGADQEKPVDLSRRGLLGAAAAGAAAAVGLYSTPQARGVTVNPELIRPPGARREPEFLERCIVCGSCMKVCPTGGLQPCLTEAGLAGLWTPRLVPRIGGCEFECNACGHVCPTEAIAPLPLADKQRVRIGLASFDLGRCLPYAFGRECLVCEEHCPTPTKAIYFTPGEFATRDGRVVVLKQPHVDPDHCTGCGLCENACPLRDAPAVRVRSGGESRDPKNQPFLAV